MAAIPLEDKSPSRALPQWLQGDERDREDNTEIEIPAQNMSKLERRLTNEAMEHPGDVRINVKGAFIVDAGGSVGEEGDLDLDGYQHDPNDIRLPHHKTIISHVAVDVWTCSALGCRRLKGTNTTLDRRLFGEARVLLV